MAENSQRPEGRGLLALKAAINVLSVVKEATNNTPANPVVGSVAVLLTMIRVSSFLFSDEMAQVHTSSGHDGQQRRFR